PRISESQTPHSVGALIERPAGKGDPIPISFGEKVPYHVNSAGNRYVFRAVNDRPYEWITIGCLEFDGDSRVTRETLNKSSAAEQRIFSSIRSVSKVGNTSSIPPLLKLSAEEKSLAVSTC
ncbi:MAG: hypothetical protein MSS94_03365, partial [Clostridiales bacterium]|nr:hypothetical protein [Clostridiales bacterium]